MKSKGNCRLYHTPVRIFATVAGIGPELAERIHEHLAIESLTELEAAAYSGRLATVPGFGPERVRGVRESLAGRLHRPISRRWRICSTSTTRGESRQRVLTPPAAHVVHFSHVAISPNLAQDGVVFVAYAEFHVQVAVVVPRGRSRRPGEFGWCKS